MSETTIPAPRETAALTQADASSTQAQAMARIELTQRDAHAMPNPGAGGDDPGFSYRVPVLVGLLVLLVTFGGVGSWAALAPLKSAAVASGSVKLDGERKTVQHLEGGIVGEILVREGDEVQVGDMLVRLDDTQARAGVELLRRRYEALLATNARLEAERDGAERIEFPAALLARYAEPKVAELVDSQRRVFVTRRTTLEGQVSILDQRIAQSRNEIAGLEAERESNSTQLDLIDEEIEAVRVIYEKGIYEKPRYLALQRTRARLHGEVGQQVAMMARVEQSINESRLRGLDLRNRLMGEVSDQLQAVQTELFTLQERLNAAEDQLERIDIRAPYAGTVVALRFHTSGGVIPPREPILDIVPQDDKLIIEAAISAQDIDVVHAGLPTAVRLSAYSSRSTPVLPGKLVQVSADRFLTAAGVPYFKGRVEVDVSALEALEDVALYPGMPAEVLIETGERTALQYLVSPIMRSMNRAMRES